MMKKYVPLLMGFLILMGSGCSSSQGIYHKGYDWSEFGQDSENSRYNPCFSTVIPGEIELLGDYETQGEITSSPALADLNGDGKPEIVFGSWDHYVYALRSSGEELWKYKTEGAVTSSPAIANLDGQGRKVIVGSKDGILYVLNSKGQLSWKYRTSGKITSSPVIADLDGNGKKEIIFGSWDKNLYVLNSEGKKIVSFETLGSIESSPAVGDVNADGRQDIIFGSDDSKIYIISPPGEGHTLEKIGVYSTSGRVISSPSLVDFTGDRFPEIVVGSSDGTFYCLSFREIDRKEEKKFKKGKWITSWVTIRTKIAKKWDYQTSGEVVSSPGIADFDGDGKLEVVVGSKDKNLYLFSSEGEKLLKYTVGGEIVSSPGIADFDGDGKLEVVVVSVDGRIYLLNSAGFRIWEYQVPGRISSSPAIADLNGDGKLEIVVGSWNKKLYIFGEKKKVVKEIPKESIEVSTTLTPMKTPNPQENTPVKERKEDTSNNQKFMGRALLNGGVGNKINLMAVLSVGLALCYFSYKKGMSTGTLEIREEEEKVINLVLEEREKNNCL